MSELFEVEKKYPLKGREGRRKVEGRLRKLGFVFCAELTQYDHIMPGTVKGELLRVREEGSTFHQTHKEKVHVDGTRVKREDEPLVHPLMAQFALIGARTVLGDQLPTMFKRRREYKGFWKGFPVTIEIDRTPVLEDMFSGYWMEVEIMVNNPKKVAGAKKQVKKLAAKILGDKRKACKMSYRKMLFKALKKAGKFPERWSLLTGGENRLICAPAV